jgi:serine/threonine-protein kinase
MGHRVERSSSPRRGTPLAVSLPVQQSSAALDSEPTRIWSTTEQRSVGGDPRLGTHVGPYRIMRALARGGMGAVYVARHQRIGREVAVKLPHPHILREPDLARRFLSEAMAAVQINHPGVVNVLDYGQAHDGAPYLVMELLAGGALAERLTGTPLPPEFVIRVGARVADTLAAAHAAGVIHRDLKPENVFLQKHRHRPDRVTVKVLDFGFAKLSDIAGGGVPKTQQGLILGTPSYMSPEQCLGFVPTDSRSDIYSLGCILYEMIAGKLPFFGTLDQMKRALSQRDIVAPRWLVPGLPPLLDDLVMRMLARHPDDRIGTMTEVARSFEWLGADLARTTRRRAVAAGTGRQNAITVI